MNKRERIKTERKTKNERERGKKQRMIKGGAVNELFSEFIVKERQ